MGTMNPLDYISDNSTKCNNGSCFKNKTTEVSKKYFTEMSITIFQTLYISVMVLGIIGNVLTAVAILARRSIGRSIHLYTFNLVVCDILILSFDVPAQVTQIKDQLSWKIGELLCRVINIGLAVSITCSIATLVAITYDRARGLRKPFKWRAEKAREIKKAKWMVPVIWSLSFLVNIPLYIYERLETEGTLVLCGEGWPEQIVVQAFSVTNFVLTFTIPLTVITLTYILMIYTIKKGKKNINQTYNKRMIRMVVGVLVFLICTGWKHIFYFVYTFGNIRIPDYTVGYLYGIAHLLVSVQAAINPFLYCNMQQDVFRVSKKKTSKTIFEIGRLSAYLVVRADIYDEEHWEEYDSCAEQNGDCPNDLIAQTRREKFGKYSPELRDKINPLHKFKKRLVFGSPIIGHRRSLLIQKIDRSNNDNYRLSNIEETLL